MAHILEKAILKMRNQIEKIPQNRQICLLSLVANFE